MRKMYLAALAVSVLAGSAQAQNLVQNGSFTQNTLPASLTPSNASGAEIDPLWNYNGAVTDWSSPLTSSDPQVYNIYVFGDSNAAVTDADTRYTSAEPQHINSNFTGDSPDGGAFMLLDADPDFTGPLEQTINNLVVGQRYVLSFDWAAGELSNRTGYTSSQLTGTFGTDSFATPIYDNANPAGTPGSFSGWSQVSFDFTAQSTSQVLSFLAVGSPAGNLPPVALLDGVSLTVPEPSAWALMMLGVGGMGVALRRRRRLAAV
jgi:hypothetical protein